MQTLDFSIDIPKGNTMNLVLLKEKVIEYANSLLSRGQYADTPNCMDKDLEEALRFVESLAVKGGENIPVEDDGCAALVELKHQDSFLPKEESVSLSLHWRTNVKQNAVNHLAFG